MNFPLVFRYFVHNHRRTVVAIQILSIGIIAISGTIQMVNVLSSQIDTFAVIPSQGNSEVIELVPEGEFFNSSSVLAIREVAKKYNLSRPVFTYETQSFILQDGSSYPIPLTVTNISEYLPRYFPVYSRVSGLNENNSGLYIDRSSSFAVQSFGIDLNLPIVIRYNETGSAREFVSYVYSAIESSDFYGLLLDFSRAENLTGWNKVFVTLNKYQRSAPIFKDLENIEGIHLVTGGGKDEFIRESAKQIINILYALYLMISLLSFLSIAVLIKAIIDESWHEIRIFKSLGFSTFQVSLIFVGQASLIGFIGSLFGIVVSFLLVNSTFSILSIFGIGVFIPPQLYFMQGLQRIIESLLLTTTASIIPIYTKLWRN